MKTKPFRPMLAATLPEGALPSFPVLASPKIDGVRAIVVNGQLVSRSLKPIRNRYTQALFGRPELEGFDGELVVGAPNAPDVMQTTTSGVMSVEGQPSVRFYAFDLANLPEHTYEERLGLVEAYTTDLEDVFYLPHVVVNDAPELERYEAECLAHGYEGVMLRDPNGYYKQGRSTLREGGLVKVKRFRDDEAVVVGFEERQHNANELQLDERGYAKRSHVAAGMIGAGTLGALHVEMNGVRFSIGTGFTDAQRAEIWSAKERYLGRLAKFKHFAVTGVKDAPRFPVFLGWRDKEDV
jgi:DNA ligase-1